MPDLLPLDPPDPWFTTAEAARYTKAHKTTLYRAVAAGRLEAGRLDHDFRFRKSALDAWLMARPLPLSPE